MHLWGPVVHGYEMISLIELYEDNEMSVGYDTVALNGHTDTAGSKI
jgi:hypothetical protein